MTNKIKVTSPPFILDGNDVEQNRLIGGAQVTTSNPFASASYSDNIQILATVNDLNPIGSVIGGVVREISNNLSDLATTIDSIDFFTITKVLADTTTPIDTVSTITSFNRDVNDSVGATESIDFEVDYGWTVNDTVISSEDHIWTFDKVASELITPQEFVEMGILKPYADVATVDDPASWLFEKPAADVVASNDLDPVIDYGKNTKDTINPFDAVALSASVVYNDFAVGGDDISLDYGKPVSDSITSIDEAPVFDMGAVHSDEAVPVDQYAIDLARSGIDDTFTPTELVGLWMQIPISDIVTATDNIDVLDASSGQLLDDSSSPSDQINQIAISKVFSDAVTAEDLIGVDDGLEYAMILSRLDSITASELLSAVSGNPLGDTLNTPTDELSWNVGKTLSDTLSTPTDSLALSPTKVLADIVNPPTDAINAFDVIKSLTDTQGTIDSAYFDVSSVLSDSITQTELVGLHPQTVLASNTNGFSEAGELHVQDYFADEYVDFNEYYNGTVSTF